jgi:uncharacterized membrane protein YfcA
LVKYLILVLAGLAGGAVNALAGGGTFITFPALLLIGMGSVRANATASLVLIPAMLASAWVYRDTMRQFSARYLALVIGASLAGSLTGSMILMNTSNHTFSQMVPWLLLTASLVFTFAPRIRAFAERIGQHDSTALLLAGQTAIAAYGGFFGAGMGVLMLTLFLIATRLDVHSATAIRMICAVSINLLAVVVFASHGAIDFTAGIPMLVAGIFGGYAGARFLRSLDAAAARRAILIFAWALTVWFFGRMLVP